MRRSKSLSEIASDTFLKRPERHFHRFRWNHFQIPHIRNVFHDSESLRDLGSNILDNISTEINDVFPLNGSTESS